MGLRQGQALACVVALACVTPALAQGPYGDNFTDVLYYYVQASAPGTPDTGDVGLYWLSTGPCYKDDAGTVTCFCLEDGTGCENTFCSGTTTYLDGEGNCDDIAPIYADVASSENITGAWTIDQGAVEAWKLRIQYNSSKGTEFYSLDEGALVFDQTDVANPDFPGLYIEVADDVWDAVIGVVSTADTINSGNITGIQLSEDTWAAVVANSSG